MRTTGCSEFDFARLFLPAYYRQEQGHARPPLRTFGLRNPEPQEEHRLTPARSFASPARTHDTKRNNFPVGLTPPTSDIWDEFLQQS